MREIMHFNSEKEKIAYLRGHHTEITPTEVVAETEVTEVTEVTEDAVTEEIEEEEEDEVQAE